MIWNNKSIEDISSSDTTNLCCSLLLQGLKKYKGANFIKAAKYYMDAYNILYKEQDKLDLIRINDTFYLGNNAFLAFRNCTILRISQITMFLNKQYLYQFLPLAAVSECIEFDEAKLKQEIINYSGISPETYFAKYYATALPLCKKLFINKDNLQNYIMSINQNLAPGPSFAKLKREFKYRISGIY